MKRQHPTIQDPDGNVLYYLVPPEEYQMHFAANVTQADTSSLISEDGLKIYLPEAGEGDHIDLVRLARYCVDTSLVAMGADDDRDSVKEEYAKSFPINMRQQALKNFEARQMGSLDPLIRAKFLPKDSPYKNTMQATTAVVDALVETGLFSRSKRKFDFYRPVNSLDFNLEAAKEFLKDKPEVKNRIDPYFWYKKPWDKA